MCVNEFIVLLSKFIARFVYGTVRHKSLYVLLLVTCDFSVSRLKDGPSFIMGVNKLTYEHVP